MDEVIMAGGKSGSANSSYYLFSGQDYWTMSPSYCWWYNSVSSRFANAFLVWSDGSLSNDVVDSTRGIRPVINLKADTLFATGGNGTHDNPYIVQA